MSTADEQWSALQVDLRGKGREFFDGQGDIVCARAPGRLDVLGGIADYSGSVVLESTLSLATFAAVQMRSDGVLHMRSAAGGGNRDREAVTDLSLLTSGTGIDSYAEVGARLTHNSGSRWTAYIAGCLYVLCAEGLVDLSHVGGLNILVDSAVPIGAGVSSSAALEVAVMTAVSRIHGVELDGMATARLCQIVENRVVGAPCGIMDQVTCSLGQESALLALKCQPHDVIGFEAVPPGWRFVGLDSDVKHSVGGRAYAMARIGAFMGYAVIRRITGQNWGGYLCNVDVDTWNAVKDQVPVTLTGEEFTRAYGPLGDPVSTVVPGETYRVRACSEHPILENARVREFLALMELAQTDSDSGLKSEAGRLMLDAHRSYSDRVELGSPETDLLASLAMKEGQEAGIYGAKITGGGSGGTVAILCGREGDMAIQRIREEYNRLTGRNSRLMTGSSPGAAAFGPRTLQL